MNILYDEKLKLWYRPDTFDLESAKRMRSDNRFLIVNKEDIIFDIGANIGSFTRSYFDKVKKVYSFESERDNFKLLERNVKGISNVRIFNCAVVNGNEKEVEFYLNKGKCKGYHSLVMKRGREKVKVSSMNFLKLINKYKPSVLKIDIEGYEYDLLCEDIIPDSVKKIMIEFHFCNKKIREELFDKTLKNLIKKNKFKLKNDMKYSNKSWQTMGYFER